MFIKPPRIRLIFDRNKRATDKIPGAIEIEVYYNQKQYRVHSLITVYPNEWRRGMVVKRPDATELNDHLSEVMARINKYVRKCYESKMTIINLLTLKSLVYDEKPSGSPDDFFGWLEERIKSRPLRKSTRRTHMVMFRSLRSAGDIKTFRDVTVANIKKWDDLLVESLGCQTTVYSYHKRLKPYIAEAVCLGLIEENPYKKLKIPRGTVTNQRKYLTEEERTKIENLKDLPSAEAKTRDLFIFCCYTGLAFSDATKIKPKDIFEEHGKLYLEDFRMKTSSRYKIQLLPKAVEILQKYDYDLDIISNQKCNDNLKIIAVKAGLKGNLTSHMGRHTFATWALSNHIRIEVVSKMLAHADIKTTQIYAKILQEDVNSGYDQLEKLTKKKKKKKGE